MKAPWKISTDESRRKRVNFLLQQEGVRVAASEELE